MKKRIMCITRDGLCAVSVVDLDATGSYPPVIVRPCAQKAVDFFKEPRQEAPTRRYERSGWAVSHAFVRDEQVPRYVEVNE